jgi:hypothetical protein
MIFFSFFIIIPIVIVLTRFIQFKTEHLNNNYVLEFAVVVSEDVEPSSTEDGCEVEPHRTCIIAEICLI